MADGKDEAMAKDMDDAATRGGSGAGAAREADAGSAHDEIRQFVVTPLQTNCYAYISQGECMVVDPGGSGARIAEELSDVHVVLIACTHGHGDHTGGVLALKKACGAPYAINHLDAERAMHAAEVSEVGRSYDDDAPEPDRDLEDGDVLEIGTARFRVIACPGHTPGGVSLLGEGSAAGVCFVGDTLFPGSCGRTDLSGGDQAAIARSLRHLAEVVPPETAILCGHGSSTTMARELATNPFLQ